MEEPDLDFTRDMFSLWAKAYQASYKRFLETPVLGPNREAVEDFQKNMDANLSLYASWLQSAASFQSVFAEATRKMREKLAEMTVEEGAEETAEKFYETWLQTYSDTFHDFLKSKYFSDDLKTLVSNTMDAQMSDRELFEKNALKPMNLPTRTEIDEINKEVYNLRKKVKELTKQIEELSKQR
jgi:class III poly(R)-hydroxyalkanoic acid synthase PhaE subunit